MVEYSLNIDNIFASLADPTRRDILKRVSGRELSVGEIARPYPLTFAAVSKHLKVMERANLIIKRRSGKEQLVSMAPGALTDAAGYLEWYRSFWENRLEALDQYLTEEA